MEYIMKVEGNLFAFYTSETIKDINGNDVVIPVLSSSSTIEQLNNYKNELENALNMVNEKLTIISNYIVEI